MIIFDEIYCFRFLHMRCFSPVIRWPLCKKNGDLLLGLGKCIPESSFMMWCVRPRVVWSPVSTSALDSSTSVALNLALSPAEH